jgi:hypothetical protein
MYVYYQNKKQSILRNWVSSITIVQTKNWCCIKCWNTEIKSSFHSMSQCYNAMQTMYVNRAVAVRRSQVNWNSRNAVIVACEHFIYMYLVLLAERLLKAYFQMSLHVCTYVRGLSANKCEGARSSGIDWRYRERVISVTLSDCVLHLHACREMGSFTVFLGEPDF